MLGRDLHDRIVAHLYASAMGEVPWVATLGLIADAFGHSAGVLVAVDPNGGYFAHSHGRPQEFTNQFYASDIFANDPRTPHYLTVPPGTIYYDRSLYDVEAMLRDDRVQHTIETIGVSYQLATTLRLPAAGSAMLTILSTEREGHATEAQIRDFRRLAPHIEQATALGELMERRAAIQAGLLDALASNADGILLLDALGAPSFVNDAARAILAEGDGLTWTREGLAARRGPETRRLRQLIRTASEARLRPSDTRPGGQMVVTRASGLRPCVVRVLPVPASDRILSMMSVACMIHIHDLAAIRLPSRAVLHEAFGLTEREADLAVELVRCASLAGAAERAGMALNTARNHLQGLFRKCGVATQAEAVQLLGRLP